MKSMAVLVGLALLLAGCGASDEELHEARARGERAGRKLGHEEAWAEAKKQIASEREEAYWEGNIDGEEEAYELEEELDAEEAAELRNEFGINPTPTKENGESSYEFEPEDIEQAEEGYEDEELREYCEGASSEAQEVGCLSHVDPSEVP